MPNSTAELREQVLGEARALGFDDARIAAIEDQALWATHLEAFLREGRHGTMDWLARHADKRASPGKLWPEARSAIVVAANYGPDCDPKERLACASRGVISVYAQGDDYHDVMKSKLRRLAEFLQSRADCDVKVFVDTAPVMEKPLAQKAGLGWQGKHTNLVSRSYGSWLFLGTLFTTVALDPDPPETDHCGGCRRCLDACPTDAFTAPYRIDARRCISYLTIEHKGHIPDEFRVPMGNRIYGCDDCLDACPWNKFAQTARETRFHARETLRNPRLEDLAALDDAGFRALFKGSPIKRIGRDRFVRNVLIAIGNSKDTDLAHAAEARLGDASPLVRAMAVWALSRILPAARFAALFDRMAEGESDSQVEREWRAGRRAYFPEADGATSSSDKCARAAAPASVSGAT